MCKKIDCLLTYLLTCIMAIDASRSIGGSSNSVFDLV